MTIEHHKLQANGYKQRTIDIVNKGSSSLSSYKTPTEKEFTAPYSICTCFGQVYISQLLLDYRLGLSPDGCHNSSPTTYCLGSSANYPRLSSVHCLGSLTVSYIPRCKNKEQSGGGL